MGAEPAIQLAAKRIREPASSAPPGPQPDRIIVFAVLVRVVMLLDVLLLGAASLAVSTAFAPDFPPGQLAVALGLFLYATISALRALSAYRAAHLARLGAALRIALLASALGTLGLAAVVALLGGIGDTRATWIASVLAASFTVLGIARGVLALLLALWRATGRLTRQVAVIGANDYSRSFIEAVRGDPASGLSIVGLYDDRLNRVTAAHAAAPVLGNVGTLIADASSAGST